MKDKSDFRILVENIEKIAVENFKRDKILYKVLFIAERTKRCFIIPIEEIERKAYEMRTKQFTPRDEFDESFLRATIKKDAVEIIKRFLKENKIKPFGFIVVSEAYTLKEPVSEEKRWEAIIEEFGSLHYAPNSLKREIVLIKYKSQNEEGMIIYDIIDKELCNRKVLESQDEKVKFKSIYDEILEEIEKEEEME